MYLSQHAMTHLFSHEWSRLQIWGFLSVNTSFLLCKHVYLVPSQMQENKQLVLQSQNVLCKKQRGYVLSKNLRIMFY